MRGILDGHLWLNRDLANRGHYPAVDILESISRVMVDIVEPEHLQAARRITQLQAVYRDIEDLVNIGAYAPGTNPEYDLAIQARNCINEFLCQGMSEVVILPQAIQDVKDLAQAIDTMAESSDTAPVAAPASPANGKENPPARIGLERMMAGI
jgi:flagellum-specific ATP synthase